MKYTLMHKNIPVTVLSLDERTGFILKIEDIFHIEHLPVGIHVRKGVIDRAELNTWWIDRSIPASRSGINHALEVLGVPNTKVLLTKCSGLSLSDQYWIRPIDRDDISWSDINFFENSFSEDIGDVLLGKVQNGKGLNLYSPDNTSDGCLKKRWKIIDGKRCLIKGGSNPFIQQPFNEVAATVIMEALHIPHVPYYLIWEDGKPYSVCEDFVTPDTELVSAWRVMQTKKKDNSTSVYRHYINCCESLGVSDIVHAVDQMIVLDYIIANEDRHQNNFGLLRNAETLEWIGAAPIYDSGSSLGYDKVSKQILSGSSIECKPFKKSHAEQLKLVSSFDWVDFTALQNADEMIRNVFAEALQYSEAIDESRVNAIAASVKKHVSEVQTVAMQRQTTIDDVSLDLETDIAENYLSHDDGLEI